MYPDYLSMYMYTDPGIHVSRLARYTCSNSSSLSHEWSGVGMQGIPPPHWFRHARPGPFLRPTCRNSAWNDKPTRMLKVHLANRDIKELDCTMEARRIYILWLLAPYRWKIMNPKKELRRFFLFRFRALPLWSSPPNPFQPFWSVPESFEFVPSSSDPFKIFKFIPSSSVFS